MFAGGGFNVFVKAKVYSIINTVVMILQPAVTRVLNSGPLGLIPTGV